MLGRQFSNLDQIIRVNKIIMISCKTGTETLQLFSQSLLSKCRLPNCNRNICRLIMLDATVQDSLSAATSIKSMFADYCRLPGNISKSNLLNLITSSAEVQQEGWQHQENPCFREVVKDPVFDEELVRIVCQYVYGISEQDHYMLSEASKHLENSQGHQEVQNELVRIQSQIL